MKKKGSAAGRGRLGERDAIAGREILQKLTWRRRRCHSMSGWDESRRALGSGGSTAQTSKLVWDSQPALCKRTRRL